MKKASRRKSRENRKTCAGHRLNKIERVALKEKRRKNLAAVREGKEAVCEKINPRTQASNSKSPFSTVIDQTKNYEYIASAQIKVWRSLLPSLMLKLSKIKDPRNPNKVKHKLTVLMMFGLFQCVLRLKSRRAFNEHLTNASLFEQLNKIFPDIDSIPHADTVARLLERIDVAEIERIHISMIRKLIKQKKFKKLLINQCMPVSVDGTQKTVRDGQLQEEGWLVRTITTQQGKEYQQYVYVLEANITFANGLNIPLLTEYCCLDADAFSNVNAKQDCEINGFYRLTDRLKKHFPRLKIIALLDNLYACETVIAHVKEKRWEFMIKLPKKLKQLYDPLQTQRGNRVEIPGQPYYRERKQAFHWINHRQYKGHQVHVVGCTENWEAVCNKTGDILKQFSEHTWISSVALSLDNIHERCNLAARKRYYIEDSFNTEKNRGYQYQHVFSYNWNAMKGFHYLMRLAHAINALSEFTKRLKKTIKQLGWSITLNRIFEAIKHRWLSDDWMQKELEKTPQLRFDFEFI